MNKTNPLNEKIKRKFYEYLEHAEGVHVTTIDNLAKSIEKYELFIEYKDLRKLTARTIIAYKKWLKEQTFNGKRISVVTYHTNIRNLRKFYNWLLKERVPKKKINPNDLAYLNTSKKEERRGCPVFS